MISNTVVTPYQSPAGKEIECEEKVKDLGITINEKLKFRDNTEKKLD